MNEKEVKLANFQNEREQLAQLEDLFQLKKFIAGLAQAETVLQQFPSSFHLKFLQIKFLKELQRPDEALKLLLEMHARFGDNILILKELADLNFQQKRLPESLIYYNKLLFLDSFNGQAQERVKQIQGLLEAGVIERLADTKIEVYPDDSQPPAAVKAPAAEELPLLITFTTPTEPEALAEGKTLLDHSQELNFETESAAELYFKQGLFNESLAIYKKLFEKTANTDYFLKIKTILPLLCNGKNGRIIERLQRFLELIQKRGKQIV
jgi:tetratricopeptide (TPR) repeat protein